MPRGQPHWKSILDVDEPQVRMWLETQCDKYSKSIWPYPLPLIEYLSPPLTDEQIYLLIENISPPLEKEEIHQIIENIPPPIEKQ